MSKYDLWSNSNYLQSAYINGNVFITFKIWLRSLKRLQYPSQYFLHFGFICNHDKTKKLVKAFMKNLKS